MWNSGIIYKPIDASHHEPSATLLEKAKGYALDRKRTQQGPLNNLGSTYAQLPYKHNVRNFISRVFAKLFSVCRVDVIKARNSVLNAKNTKDEINASNEMSASLTKLFALAESYPELKANENCVSLQESLKETEDKISYARQFYNDNVMNYKNKLEVFPSNVIASMFNFKPEPFFEATSEERKNVEVKF